MAEHRNLWAAVLQQAIDDIQSTKKAKQKYTLRKTLLVGCVAIFIIHNLFFGCVKF